MKKPITKSGNANKKYFGFLLTANIVKYITHIDIAIAGISIVPLAVHSIFNEKLENNMAPNKLVILFNFSLNNKYVPILDIGKNIPVTVNIAI
ncbi:hypothetical protein MARBORIA2_07970 [Methanobrevibacter arboriphilus]|uniref:Uncharacterized protein n=1 Tax=Methanobrevibacter arboriphilus TaxID=39441 RepID=A0ACA8R6B6_METAZ|nr:hypothetical protein MarbSA_16050 [Methanobrevibacter arboriphilus]GLI11707.1 hypothetical protein MARBORIA2_07970 [Methanobrevibacter arboriphilus]